MAIPAPVAAPPTPRQSPPTLPMAEEPLRPRYEACSCAVTAPLAATRPPTGGTSLANLERPLVTLACIDRALPLATAAACTPACILTLMVSRGWIVLWEPARASAPARMSERGFVFTAGLAAAAGVAWLFSETAAGRSSLGLRRHFLSASTGPLTRA